MNRNIILKSLITIMLLTLAVQTANAQDNWWKVKKFKTEAKKQKYNNCKAAFVNIGDGFLYANVFNITPYFDSEVYLNIMDSDKGHYNNEQCRYILEGFFSNNPVASFRWKNSSFSDNYAFATGKYKYKKNGYINTSTISVSLKYINDSWLIDQVNIN